MCWGRMVAPLLAVTGFQVPLEELDGALDDAALPEAVWPSDFEVVVPSLEAEAPDSTGMLIDETAAMFHGERTPRVLIPDGVGGDIGYFMKGV